MEAEVGAAAVVADAVGVAAAAVPTWRLTWLKSSASRIKKLQGYVKDVCSCSMS